MQANKRVNDRVIIGKIYILGTSLLPIPYINLNTILKYGV